MFVSERIIINVSGLRFETYESTLQRFPRTLLGSHQARKHFYDVTRGEYFFNRNRQAFDAVLFYYQSSGILRKPESVPENIFNDELNFFGITKQTNGGVSNKYAIQRANRFLLNEHIPLPKSKLQKRIWMLFSRPHSSISAQIIETISMFTLAISILVSCAKSIPDIKRDLTNRNSILARIFFYSDHVCYAWFLIEFSVQIISVYDKRVFLTSFSGVVDLFTIIPFYVQVIFEENVDTHPNHSFLRVLELLRIVRLLRVTRYSRGVRALLYTVHLGWNDLNLYLAIVLLLNILIGSVTFFFEDGHEGNLLTSIPEAMWWSVNTFTTVGYGDSYPITTPGKMIGCACSVAGIVFLGLPVYCLVSNFLLLWEAMKKTGSRGIASKVKVSIKRLKAMWMLESQKIRRTIRRR